MNGSLNECANAWFRGILEDIKKGGWVHGQMGGDNVNVWMEKRRLNI